MIEVIVKIDNADGTQEIKFNLEDVDINQDRGLGNDVFIIIKGKLAKWYEN